MAQKIFLKRSLTIRSEQKQIKMIIPEGFPDRIQKRKKQNKRIQGKREENIGEKEWRRVISEMIVKEVKVKLEDMK